MFRADTVVMLWPRGVSLYRPGAGALHLDGELAERVARGEPAADERLAPYSGTGGEPAQALAACDRLYGGWLEAMTREHAERLARITAMQARAQVSGVPRGAWPTLPLSTLRRALAVESSGARCVFIDDDADGLAVVLAERCEVVLSESDPVRRAHIMREADRAGVSVAVGEPAAHSCDAAIVNAGAPQESRAALERAAQAVRPGGLVAVRLRAPHDGAFEKTATEAGFLLRDQVREIDARVLPGPFVVDGAGDLLLYERPAEVKLPEPSRPWASLRAQPYWTLDFDALAPAAMGAEALERFLDAVQARAPRPEATRSITRAEQRELACWYDSAGWGMSCELHRSDGHLMVSLMPFDATLEYVVQTAAFQVLGDSYTRVRPHRLSHYRGEPIIG